MTFPRTCVVTRGLARSSVEKRTRLPDRVSQVLACYGRLMTDTGAVIDWLLDAEHSDPSIRWQVMRDLLEAPHSEWAAERAKVATEGWGAWLLDLEDEDGRWAGGAHFPGDFDFGGPEAERGADGHMAFQPWTATSHSLSQLREFGLDPSSDRARRAVELIGANARWEHDAQPYWEGEVEPCINGTTVANGAYFGADVAPIVERLLGERLADGGWNCEARMALSDRPSQPRSTFSRGSWSTSGQPVAPRDPGRRVGRRTSTSLSVGCSAG